MKLKPRCYVCGKPLKKLFTLFAMTQIIDRVFASCERCEPRLDRVAFKMKVGVR